jgi:hypothetical protein
MPSGARKGTLLEPMSCVPSVPELDMGDVYPFLCRSSRPIRSGEWTSKEEDGVAIAYVRKLYGLFDRQLIRHIQHHGSHRKWEDHGENMLCL